MFLNVFIFKLAHKILVAIGFLISFSFDIFFRLIQVIKRTSFFKIWNFAKYKVFFIFLYIDILY